MPNVEPLVSPILWGGDLEQQRGIVLRHGERTAYFHLYWGGNGHFASNPTLLADDLDGDGQPEAALVLTDGWGTGVHTESLYIFDLDTMTYTAVSYTHLRAHETCDNLVCRLLLEKNFFNDTATTEIYTNTLVGSVRCV